jgi:acid phosphatase
LILAAVVGCAGEAVPTATGTDAATAPPHFSHVVVIVFENKDYGEVIGNPQAPTFRRLARRYGLLTNFRGVAHPSLPNYLALVSGSTHGITNDCTACEVQARNLADTLERAGKTWKTYAEGLPHAGFTGAAAGRYAKKHDPFVYFGDVVRDPARLRRIVPLTAFGRDLAASRLPDFALVVPNLCHDMHDCSVATGDAWLDSFLRPLLHGSALSGGAIFVVFDESASLAGAGGGHVPALVLGPLVRPGARSSAPMSHYSLLRTIEDAWALPRLAQSAYASDIGGIWRATA